MSELSDNAGLIFTTVLLFVFCCAMAYFLFAFMRPMFSGAPFATTRKQLVRIMMQHAGKPGLPDGTRRKAADLGSGDGRLVIALAHAGFEAHGYEINPILAAYSRYRIKRSGLEHSAFIHRKSYWNEDMSGFDVVTLFGVSHIMAALEEKLLSELRPGSTVVSNYFVFPNWKPVEHREGIAVYVK